MLGFSWQSTGWDSMLLLHGAQVGSLVEELGFPNAKWRSQKKIIFKKRRVNIEAQSFTTTLLSKCKKDQNAAGWTSHDTEQKEDRHKITYCMIPYKSSSKTAALIYVLELRIAIPLLDCRVFTGKKCRDHPRLGTGGSYMGIHTNESPSSVIRSSIQTTYKLYFNKNLKRKMKPKKQGKNERKSNNKTLSQAKWYGHPGKWAIS